MGPTSPCVLLFLSSLLISGNAQERAKAVVTLLPDLQINAGERVTLKCEIQGGKNNREWTYFFRRDNKDIGSSESELRINSVGESDGGAYTCVGKSTRNEMYSDWSDAVMLTVTALPTATVNILSPPAPHYPGDTVTLQCDISHYEDWNYYFWVINGQEYSVCISETCTIKLVDHGFRHSCEGRRSGQPQISQTSPISTTPLTALPTVTLTVTPNPVYHGETVSLKCSVDSGPAWSYRWFNDGAEITEDRSGRHRISGDTLTITKVEPSDQGRYWCGGEIPSRTISSVFSYSISITVKAVPKVTLQSDQTDVYTGSRVTLSCSVEGSTGWSFYWYRHTTDSELVASLPTYTFTPESVSEGGQYWCRGRRGDPVFQTQYSNPVHVNVAERPCAVVTLEPNWSVIFRGESVTLRCQINGTEDTDWSYEWRTPGSNREKHTDPEYKIVKAEKSHSGDYKCRGCRKNNDSKWSSEVKLTVKDSLQPVLTVSPLWPNAGDSVTLSCDVGDDASTDWNMFFYRVVPSPPDQPYSKEPLSDRGQTSGKSSTLKLAAPSHTAGYRCRAGRGKPVYYSNYSSPQFHWSGDPHASVSLIVSTNRSQHFEFESLTLSCDLKGNSTGWTMRRYTNRKLHIVCPPARGSTTGSTCSMSSLRAGQSGVYWCESSSGEYSNAVNITVHTGPVTLESPVHPVSEGDSVTLRCRQEPPPSNPKVDFYKDGHLIRNETTGEMTIPAVSLSDEGLYKCSYSDRGESPQSWLLVRGIVLSPSTTTGVGLLVGLVVTGVSLLLLILLLLGYRKFKGTKSSAVSISSQSQSTNHALDGVQITNQNQAPGVKAPPQHAEGVEAETSNVTYAMIELKKMKKHKRKTANSAKDTIYSEVATESSSGGAGVDDVTYAQIDLKGKKAKKPDTSTAREAVYSAVRTQ